MHKAQRMRREWLCCGAEAPKLQPQNGGGGPDGEALISLRCKPALNIRYVNKAAGSGQVNRGGRRSCKCGR